MVSFQVLMLQRSSYQRESEQRRHKAWRNPWWFAVSWGRIPLPWAAADLGCQRSGVVWPELPSEHPPSSRLTAPPENSAEDGGKVRKVEQSRGKCLPGQSRHDQVGCNFRLWVCNCCHADTRMYTHMMYVRSFYSEWHVSKTGSGRHSGGIGFQLVCTMDYVGGNILLKRGKLKKWGGVIRGLFCFL